MTKSLLPPDYQLLTTVYGLLPIPPQITYNESMPKTKKLND